MQDEAFQSELILNQPRNGYRFSEDSVRLTEFIQIEPHETLLDLCTGAGVIPILLYQQRPYHKAIGVELQRELCHFAWENVLWNRLEQRVFIVHADVKGVTPSQLQKYTSPNCPRFFDVISVNPPYYPLGAGRLSVNPQKRMARHEESLSLSELFYSCQQFAHDQTRLHLSHLIQRESEIIRELQKSGFQRITRRQVFGHLVLLEAMA
ncbi:MAG: hypothetical protein U0V70_14505 [Terriglobia bacterium]